MNRLVQQVFESCLKKGLIREGDHVLVSVSGGSDSTALLYILHDLKKEINLHLSVAHFHHGLRGDDADADERFVQRLAESLSMEYTSERGDVAFYRKERRVSLQEAARELRYEFLERVRKKVGAGKIALGHTRDDQVEEILMRIIRGVGPDGLTGMAPMRDSTIIRPLLNVSKADLLRFLAQRGASHREDLSNRNVDYLRNRIRHQILPLFHEINPRFDDSVQRLVTLMDHDRNYFEQELVKRWPELSVYEREGIIVLDRQGLGILHHALASRMVRKAAALVASNPRLLAQNHVDSVLDGLLEREESAHFDLPRDVCVDISYGQVVFFKRELMNLPAPSTIERPVAGVVREAKGDVEACFVEAPPPNLNLGPWRVLVDANRISWPLTVRSVLPGDRMTPLGMAVAKKLKELFIERKISRWKRHILPVVESGGEVIWVAGLGVSEHVRVRRDSKSWLLLSYKGWLTEF